VDEQTPMDFGEMVREGLTRAGVELDRLRRIAGLQASLTGARMRRRGQREALAERVLVLQRRGELQHPEITALCDGLESTDADLRALEDQLAAVRAGQSAPPEPRQVGAAPTDEVRQCGVVILPDDQRVCAVCRTSVDRGAAFCSTCGVRL